MRRLQHSILYFFKKQINKFYNKSIPVKSEKELLYIRQACNITSKIYDKILKKNIHVGVSEKYIAQKIFQYALEMGADKKMTFPTIVGSGPNSSMVHSNPTKRKLKKGDFVTIDFGVKFKGYCSDMTRTVYLGEESDLSFKELGAYKSVKKAYNKSVRWVNEGVPLYKMQKKVIDFFAKRDFKYNYMHSLGHGLGLEVHEPPYLSVSAKPVNKQMKRIVFTIEPGLYFPGEFGIRIEDTFAMVDGKLEKLTSGSRNFFVS